MAKTMLDALRSLQEQIAGGTSPTKDHTSSALDTMVKVRDVLELGSARKLSIRCKPS